MFLFREFTLDLYKELRASLMHIFGVGWYKSRLVAAKLGLAFPYYLAQINIYNFSVLFFLLKYLVVSDVRIKRRVESNISKKIDLQGFSGLRHKLCLPVRGQRTRTNARTQRNKRSRTRVFGFIKK